jgi:hypothetical protein
VTNQRIVSLVLQAVQFRARAPPVSSRPGWNLTGGPNSLSFSLSLANVQQKLQNDALVEAEREYVEACAAWEAAVAAKTAEVRAKSGRLIEHWRTAFLARLRALTPQVQAAESCAAAEGFRWGEAQGRPHAMRRSCHEDGAAVYDGMPLRYEIAMLGQAAARKRQVRCALRALSGYLPCRACWKEASIVTVCVEYEPGTRETNENVSRTGSGELEETCSKPAFQSAYALFARSVCVVITLGRSTRLFLLMTE